MTFPLRPQSSPQRGPLYNLYRFITAQDIAGNLRLKSFGCNFSSFIYGSFQIVPMNTNDIRQLDSQANDVLTGATSNPTFNVRYWNEDLGLWVLKSPALSIAAQGAGVAYEYDLGNVNGRHIYLEMTNAPAGGQAVAVFASGAWHHESL
jgi:hypothetical protein